jgi:CheY-like chemotaxis protein
MKMQILARTFLIGAMLASGAALACGEGQFNMGQGLRYQGYLAPRPATVLIYSTVGESLAHRDALVKGLRESGHTVTTVADSGEMSAALHAQHYDVLIADYEDIDAAASGAQAIGADAPAVLPVVDRSMRKDPGLKARFANFVLDGASLGQYLKSIDSALPVASR